ncbi:MAG: hypothetical protein Q4G34_08035 [Micrococcus sp.]|nr:hypothetical protein [Micrococcus sp.]
MRVAELFRDGLSTAWATKVTSAVLAFIAASMCAATLATVGRTAAAEAAVLERIESAGSRMLVVTDAADAGLLSTPVLAAVSTLDAADAAVGLSRAQDVTVGQLSPGGPRAPLWGVAGDLEQVAELRSGRLPRASNEALILDGAAATLSVEGAAGWVRGVVAGSAGADVTIVGTATARPGFEDLDAGLLAPLDASRSPASLRVLATDAAHAPGLQSAVLDLLRAAPDQLQVSSPASLAALQAEVADDLGAFGRTLLVSVLAGGAVVMAAVVLADVLLSRKDVGRRRALGATRGVVVTVIALRTLAPVLVGVLAGVGVGVVMTARLDAVPPGSFVLGTAVLVALSALLAALPPAVFAATRDPVRVLRTP